MRIVLFLVALMAPPALALIALPALAQLAGPGGAAVTKWQGASHAAYFGSPVEWARFQAVVTADEFREIRQNSEAETKARLEEGYLVLTGCMVRACTTARAGIAVEVETGRPMAVVWVRDRKPKVYGANKGPLPAALTRLAETGAME
ncbi:MAG: hypothetical protein AAFR17_11830 [Pseudomonadota bacterium]